VVLGDWWEACALTLGLLIGYLAYAVTHHAIHHWPAHNNWLKTRKRSHALHHHLRQLGSYGVTSGFWDAVFRAVSGRPLSSVLPVTKPAPQQQRLPDGNRRAS